MQQQQVLEPTISDYMMKMPTHVGPRTSLKRALRMMDRAGTGYLPVLCGKKVVGILKESSSRAAASVLNPDIFTAGDLMKRSPMVANPQVSLNEVLDNTPYNVCGCTIVQDAKGKVVGIFTPREALTAIHDLAVNNRGRK